MISATGRGAVLVAAAAFVVGGCTADNQTAEGSSARRASAVSAATGPTAPPQLPSLSADQHRPTLVGTTRGRGSRVLQAGPPATGFDVEFACIGEGSASYFVYGYRGTVPCDGQLMLDEADMAAPHGPVAVAATDRQTWVILVQQGHMPIQR